MLFFFFLFFFSFNFRRTGIQSKSNCDKGLQNNAKNLDPSYKMDLDFWHCFKMDLDIWHCFGRKPTPPPLAVLYRIYPAIRWGFVPIEWLQITKSVLWNFAIVPIFTLPKQSQRSRSVLATSYKTDLDLWDCFGRKKTLSYNRRNTVTEEIQ